MVIKWIADHWFMWFLLVFIMVALGNCDTPAYAQSVCMSREKVVEQLGTNYYEFPVALGLASNGSVFEVFSTVNGTSWTMVVTLPNGTSCLLSEGEAWESWYPFENMKEEDITECLD